MRQIITSFQLLSNVMQPGSSIFCKRAFLFILLISGLFSTSLIHAQNYQMNRSTMIEEQIAGRGVDNAPILEAMGKVERHLFVPPEYRHLSYADQALPIGNQQTISQPYVIALTLDILDIQKTHSVLEVGTGSGYLAAILGELAKDVITVEIIEELGNEARQLLKTLGYKNISVQTGDGFNGYKEKAPYDVIIVSAATDVVPEPLISQLKIGGKLILPLGPENKVQTLTLITKQKNGKLKYKAIDKVRFVPLTR